MAKSSAEWLITIIEDCGSNLVFGKNSAEHSLLLTLEKTKN